MGQRTGGLEGGIPLSLLPYGGLLILLVAADQWTKAWAAASLKGRAAIALWPGVFELRYLENRGAAFGILQDGRWLLAVLGVILLLWIGRVFWRLPVQGYALPRILLAMVAAGGLGNMIDRLRLAYVVDFLYFSLIDFPIFNVADIWVVCGCIGLLAAWIWLYKEDGRVSAAFFGEEK